EDRRRGLVAEVVAVLVKTLGGVGLAPARGDRGARRAEDEVVERPGGHGEARGARGAAVRASDRVGAGGGAGAVGAGARPVRVVDGEGGGGRDVAGVVAVGVEALGRVGLAAAGGDGLVGGAEGQSGHGSGGDRERGGRHHPVVVGVHGVRTRGRRAAGRAGAGAV